MRSFLKRFQKDTSGATAIEYGLIAALIAVMIIAGATVAGTQLDLIFDKIGEVLTAAAPKKTS